VPVWSDCRVEVVSALPGEPPVTCDEGEVRLEGEELLVTYFDDRGPVVLAGRGDGGGHFALTGRSRPRTASLHRAGEARELVGSWEEGGERGYWSVVLPARGADEGPGA